MMHEMTRRKPEPTLLPTLRSLTSHTIQAWYERNWPFDDAVSYTQPGNGL